MNEKLSKLYRECEDWEAGEIRRLMSELECLLDTKESEMEEIPLFEGTRKQLDDLPATIN